MKKLKRIVMFLGIANPVLYGMSCTTQLRDAAATGVFDFVAATTTDTLSSVVSLDEMFRNAQE